MTINEAKEKFVAFVRSQLGTREGANNYNKYADDPKIAKLYGWVPQNQPWCCTFTNWCYLNCFGYDIGSRLTYGGTAACRNHGDCLYCQRDRLYKFRDKHHPDKNILA